MATTEKSAWEQTKAVLIPRGQATEEQNRFVCVNGRTYQVPRGQTVEVPLPVYEALENARSAEEEAFQRAKRGE